MTKQFQFPHDIPVLETERLVLRAHKLTDFEGFAANLTDPAVIRHTTAKPLAEEDAWRKFVSAIGIWAYLGYGYWAVEDKTSSTFIGEVGFADFKRNIKPSIKGIPEMGWVLASRVHGKGLGSEAVRIALEWADKNLKAPKTCCLIEDSNVPSLRLAEKFGFQEFARINYENRPVIMFERIHS